jgi:hypothetical protein
MKMLSSGFVAHRPNETERSDTKRWRLRFYEAAVQSGLIRLTTLPARACVRIPRTRHRLQSRVPLCFQNSWSSGMHAIQLRNPELKILQAPAGLTPGCSISPPARGSTNPFVCANPPHPWDASFRCPHAQGCGNAIRTCNVARGPPACPWADQTS